MRKIYTRGIGGMIIFMILMVTASFGQFGSPTNCSSPGSCNLVANPSFESSIACPSASNSQASLACNWGGYSTGESYYYSSCANSSFPNRGLPNNEHNCYGSPSGNSARTGNAAIGMIELVGGIPYDIMYSGKIYQQLNANLVNGKKYYVEMYASPSQCYGSSMKELGILFTASNPTSLSVNTMTPQVESSSLLGLGWNRVGGCFTANGTERYISIGCFRERTTQVTIGSINTSGAGAIFYYFDDIFLGELPTAGSNRTIACNNATLLGSNCGTATLPFTYSWTSSPADPSLTGQTTVLNPLVSPTVTTTYTLTVTTPNGCTNVSSVTVTTGNGGYTAGASASPYTIACGNTTTLNVTGVPAGSTYLWTATPADATLVSTTQSPVVRPTKTTTYNVTVTLPNTCKAFSNNVSVVVNPIIVTAKASSVLLCSAGLQTQLGVSGAPTGSTFLWTADPADPSLNASNNTLESPIVSPGVKTKYKVRVTSPYGCIDNDEVEVNVSTYSLGVAASSSTINCGGESILTASGMPAGTIYSWTGGGLSATSNPVLVAPLQTSTYTVTATLPNGCVLTTNPTVTVNSVLPTPGITGPTEVCPASPIQLCTNYTPPCPELGYGDAAIIGYERGGGSTANRKINLLLLRDLPSCITLYITNRPWNGTAFTGNGSTITWNSPGVTGGQIISITGAQVAFNPGDDPLYVYQNTSTGVRLLHGLGFNGITPNGLINGMTATVLSNSPMNRGLALAGSSGLTQQALFNRLLSAGNWTINSINSNTGVTIVGRPVTGLSWNTGATTNCISVSSGGTYAVTYTDIHGCTASVSQSVSTIACCPAPLTTTCTGNTYSYIDNFQVFYAQGMAIGVNDSIYVSNSSTYTIDVFTSSKTFVRSIPGLSLPIGIDVDNNGNIFVANHADRSIAKISPAGAIVATWPVLNTIGETMYPIHVTTDHCGNVYATVTHGYWVTEFDNNGNFIRNIDAQLSGEPTNLTQSLTGVAVDGLFNLFVADNVNHKIKKFDANGNYVTHWTTTQNVYELAVDRGGNVYTTELYGGISKYSNSGTLLANFTAGSGWEGAIGVDVDSDCNVWTSENNYVRKFDYTSTLPKMGAFNEMEEASESVHAYPNPSSAGITVDFTTEGSYDIVIYNSVGAEVYRNTVKGESFEIVDDVLSAGLYTIHISGNGFNSKMIKVVKE